MSIATFITRSSPFLFGRGRPSFLMLALWLCGQAGVTPPARAVPAYETIRVVGPATPADAFVHANNMNDDGAVPFAWYDEARTAWAMGAWLPVPLYGKPAGYSEHYTVPVTSGRGSIWPFIDQAGVVSYVGTGFPGSPDGIVVNGTPVTLPWPPGECDGFVCGRSVGPTAGLIGGTLSSAPVAFAHWAIRQSNRDTIFQPYTLTYAAAFSLDNGLQTLGMPGGFDYAQVAFATRTGHRVWIGYNEVGDPAQGTAGLESFYYVESTAGSFATDGVVNWITGRGDVVYVTTETGFLVRLAGPLGPLGPGIHRQADIPGMPANYQIAAMNNAGVILALSSAPGLRVHRVVAGGKSALLSSLTTLPVPANGTYGMPSMNESGMLLVSPVGTGSLGTHLLIPTLDCDVTLSGEQPYRLDDEFDIDVTVRNVAGLPVTDVRVEGDTPGASGLSVSSWPAFDTLSGPTPAGPVTLATGATQVFRYHVKAKRSGVGEVTAKVKGTSSRGTALRAQAAAPIDIEQRGDLLLKLAEEPAASFALNDVYQRGAPSGAQDRKVEIVSEGEMKVFEVKVQNDEPRPLTFRVGSLETGSTAIPAKYLFGTNDITGIIKSQGWITPELAAGASVTLRVEFGPTDRATGGETRAARLSLTPLDSGAICDLVRMEVVNAPPVGVTLRKGSTTGLTSQSIQAGKSSADAPLIFKEDIASLRFETEVKRGLVADGVTPLLLEMKVPPESLAGLPDGIEYRVELQVASGGTLGGGTADSRLRVMKEGHWSLTRLLKFTEAENVQYAFVMPFGSDDLQFSAGSTELKLRLRFTRPQSTNMVTDKTVLLRKPPIVLVHGYNTDGEWGPDYYSIFQISRPAEFIRTIRYGQEPSAAGATARQNTVLLFGQLVPILDFQLQATAAQFLADGWAFTRIDYVGHSQGGVLGRMLCSQNGNQHLPLPFRNPENFFRGRFHRVVTIGSPHNGTRIVHYMLRLRERLYLTPNPLNPNVGIPSVMAEYLVSNGTAQKKFDPFGSQILLLNKPESTGPWYPDPAARFHLVQTTVNSGLPPNVASFSPADAALGFLVNGADVLPNGSDGVVDFDSMTATTPEAGQSPPPNSFRMPDTLQIAHALVFQGGVNLFAGDAGQVDSLFVARHVIHALDQNPLVPAQDRVFGPFRVAAPLPQSVADQIQAAANAVSPGVLDTIRSVTGGGFQAAGGQGGAGLVFNFHPPAGETLAGPVQWSVERYGAGGVTTDGLTVQAVPGNFARVTVLLNLSTWGDVVLYGTARTLSGRVIIAAPKVILSVEPDEVAYSLSEIEVRPDGGEYPVGAAIEPQLWATYYSNPDAEGNGGGDEYRLQRWIALPAFQAFSAPSDVVDVSNPQQWVLAYTGDAQVSVDWRGLTTSVQFSAFAQNVNGVDHDYDGVASVDEANVPNRQGGPFPGDGNGDGIADRQQWHVVSVRGLSGQWFTLQSPGVTRPLFEVAPGSAPADLRLLPTVHAFDHGFLTFSVGGMTNGEIIALTLHIPSGLELDTVWAYGPTTDNPAPHWHEFLDNGATGAQIETNRVLIRAQDGGRGDGDGAANGTITGLTLGLARRIPAVPSLRIALDSPGQHAVAWPSSFPNAARTYLEFTEGLSPSNQWQFLPEVPVQTGVENRLISPNAGTGKFYRLRGQ